MSGIREKTKREQATYHFGTPWSNSCSPCTVHRSWTAFPALRHSDHTDTNCTFWQVRLYQRHQLIARSGQYPAAVWSLCLVCFYVHLCLWESLRQHHHKARLSWTCFVGVKYKTKALSWFYPLSRFESQHIPVVAPSYSVRHSERIPLASSFLNVLSVDHRLSNWNPSGYQFCG